VINEFTGPQVSNELMSSFFLWNYYVSMTFSDSVSHSGHISCNMLYGCVVDGSEQSTMVYLNSLAAINY